jgi:hypothetical protein
VVTGQLITTKVLLRYSTLSTVVSVVLSLAGTSTTSTGSTEKKQ